MMYSPKVPLGTLIFDTTDTLGRRIVLEEERFLVHIIGGHLEMKGNEEAIKETIESPLIIMADKYFPQRVVYFGESTKSTRPLIITATVDNGKPDFGFVVTSHFLKVIKVEGANIIYDKKTDSNKL